MTTKRTILIVDDDLGFRKTLFDILKIKGYMPIAVGEGYTALDKVKTQNPVVVLIDLKLEDMSGLDLMSKIKQYNLGIECILLTGHASQASAIKAINLGAYGYMQKPYDVEQLLLMIRRAIEKRDAEDAVRDYAEQLKNHALELEQRVAERTADLEAANTELARASKLKDEFLANISHELRTPLNGILGYAQILKRNRQLDNKQETMIDAIQHSGEHLLALINDILDFSKIEAGQMSLNPTPLNLKSFLDDIVNVCQIRADKQNITFNHQILNTLPPTVQADEIRLRQVLLNILGNAIKFTEHGEVFFKVTPINTSNQQTNNTHLQSSTCYLRFEVIDTGPGMTADQLTKIFSPFEQVGNLKSRAEGTGLGLAISQKLVEAMGSTLQVKSKVDQGSTFWLDLELPVVTVEIDHQEILKQNIQGYKGAPYKILIVDDKEDNRSIFINLLEPLGFKTYQAKDGEEAILKTQQLKPHVILMDTVMPKMMGLEATQQIRQLPFTKNTVIITSSASAFAKDKQQSLLAGSNAFLPKPIQAEKLFMLLEKHLNIEWIYEETNQKTVETKKENIKTQVLVPPSQKQLEKLLELANIGNMRDIKKYSVHLKQTNEELVPFANKLYQLARNFEDVLILDLLNQFIKN